MINKISVALCTYNGEAFVRQQIDSILCQSVCVDEIVVVDDRSTDSTPSILAEYDRAFPGLFTYVVNEKNMGARRNFEKALCLCTGDVICLSDQDDVWKKNKVDCIVSYFDHHPGCDGVYSDGSLIDANGNETGRFLLDYTFLRSRGPFPPCDSEFLYRSIILGNIVTGATLAIRKTAVEYLVPFHLQDTLWHDGWMAFSLLARGTLRCINEPLIWYRMHDKQQVGIDETRPFEEYVLASVKNASADMTMVYNGYRKAVLLMDSLRKVTSLNGAVCDRVRKDFLLSKNRYFKSQPFVIRKMRLVRWYIRGREVSLKDIFLL